MWHSERPSKTPAQPCLFAMYPPWPPRGSALCHPNRLLQPTPLPFACASPMAAPLMARSAPRLQPPAPRLQPPAPRLQPPPATRRGAVPRSSRPLRAPAAAVAPCPKRHIMYAALDVSIAGRQARQIRRHVANTMHRASWGKRCAPCASLTPHMDREQCHQGSIARRGWPSAL